MKSARKSQVLALLHAIPDEQGRPTLRDAGVSEKEAQYLANEGLMRFGDQGPTVASALDRYVLYELTPKALVWLHQNPAGPSPVAKISRALGSKLWDLVWDAAKVASGILVGYLLAKWLH